MKHQKTITRQDKPYYNYIVSVTFMFCYTDKLIK